MVGAGHAREFTTMMTEDEDRGHGPLLPGDQPGHRALRRGRVSLAEHVYLVTATTVGRGRERVFVDFGNACLAARCFGNKDLLGDATLLAWVLMPDHAHWLLRLGERDSLGVVVNRLKSASARVVNRRLGRRGSLWAPAYHDHGLREEDDLRAAARYVVANPVRGGLVGRVGDYPFWDAVWL